MLKNCVKGRKVTETVEGKCSKRQQEPNSDKFNYYLSEPNPGGFMVNLEPGQRLLDRFNIKSLLGSGGQGSVYLAADELKSMDVALKVVPVESELAANQLRNEIALNSKVVDYSHIIRIHDIHSARHNGIALLLVSMEYAGRSLRQWLQENKDNIEKRQTEGPALLKQACLAIKALHAVGIVHRDIKPENFLVVDDLLKIADLGLSRHMQNIGMSNCNCQGSFSPGTPAYMSPEQTMGAHPDDIDERSDIYALGILAFEFNHPGCRPPFGGTFQQIRQRHLLRVAAPSLENTEPHIASVIARCLQNNPADRYSTVQELLDDLEGKVDETQDPQLHDDTEQPTGQVELLWQQACQYMSVRKLAEADKLCSQILNICPDHDDAGSMHEDIQKRFQQAKDFYHTITQGIRNQPITMLTSLLSEAVNIYPEHSDASLAQNQLLSIIEEYKNAIDEGIEAIRTGFWRQAQTSFEIALQLNPGFPAIKKILDFVSDVCQQVEAAKGNIDAAIEQGNRTKAMALARDLDQYVEKIKEQVR